MGRTARIALIAVLGALVLTLAIMLAVSPFPPGASAPPVSRADSPPAASPVPGHCRTAIEPDAACTAAWEVKRRQFFREQDVST